MSPYHYRITVETVGGLDALEPIAGEGGLESLSFFASTSHDILAAANSLRTRLDCSACHATMLAVALGLFGEVLHLRREPELLSEPMLLGSLKAAPAKTDS